MPRVDVYVSEDYEKRRRRYRRRALTFFLLLLCLAAVAGLWLVVHSPLFRIREVELTGAKAVLKDEILTLLRSKIPQGSLVERSLGFTNILVWPDELQAGDMRLLPRLKNVAIGKKYDQRTVVVRVEEREPFGIWCLVEEEVERCYWFDREGLMFEKSLSAEGNIIPAVRDRSGRKLGLGSKILPSEFVPHLLSIFRVLRATEVNVEEVLLDDLVFQELKVLTYDGPELYFSLRFSAESSAAVIESLKEKSGFGKLEYIDFRVENRAYYR